MIPVQIKITEYDQKRNVCKAELQNGNIIEIDPFVGCAITLTDEDYLAGRGAQLIGNIYVLTAYSVYPTYVLPHQDGMTALGTE